MAWIIFLLLPFLFPMSTYAQHDMSAMPESGEMSKSDRESHMSHGMEGIYGPYPMTRDASGTSWQPDSSPMEMISFRKRNWELMLHGYVFGIFDHQSGPRGDQKFFSTSMFMFMAEHKVAEGNFAFRGMLSLDPAMGKKGYPLLLQTGETADGRTPLIDRQHPHDLFMEIAATYSYPIFKTISAFAYLGYPGEPALGPPAYMHRFSAEDNPEAPLSHHWLDSTHITFGVATVGLIWKKFKLEGSAFKGREPDQNRWNFDSPKLNSYSGRLSFNPSPNWSFQVSGGHLHSPEQLSPKVDVDRYTFSAIYNKAFKHGNWQTTFAWGRNVNHPGHTLDAFLLESALNIFRSHTVFTRLERVDKDELFLEPNPFAGKVFTIYKASLGYVYDLLLIPKIKIGMGIVGGLYFLPSRLERAYGEHPYSFMIFARIRTRQ